MDAPAASNGTMAPMNTKEMLSDEELAAQASLWRTRALQGEFEARGIAHELEREMRRRAGAPAVDVHLAPADIDHLPARRIFRLGIPAAERLIDGANDHEQNQQGQQAQKYALHPAPDPRPASHFRHSALP